MASQIFRSLAEVRFDPSSVITVGTFDGLHRGHQAIIAELKQEARARQGNATVVTFDPHPQVVLQRADKPPVQILTTTAEKMALLQRAEVERILVIPFTLEFSRTASETFVRDILHRRVGLQAMVIGHDHGFGKNREGDFATLERMRHELGFAVREVPPFEINGVILSSTKTREALLNGEIAIAAHYLGRFYALSGIVERGDERGRQLGFPTANLRPTDENKLIPANGVYAVWAEVENQKYAAMMNIGLRPTFDKTARTLEVHLLDFSGDLYGAILNVYFIARLRPEQRFDSPQALMAQLRKDKESAAQALKNEKMLAGLHNATWPH